jgi:hypothetical protein
VTGTGLNPLAVAGVVLSETASHGGGAIMRRVVVIGYGMAGSRLVEGIRRRDPCGERVDLTVVGAEEHRPYNRTLLSTVVAGLPGDAIALPDNGVGVRDTAGVPHTPFMESATSRVRDRRAGAVRVAVGAPGAYVYPHPAPVVGHQHGEPCAAGAWLWG